jgi:transposase
MELRMFAHPQMMASRRSIVEHPFGNLKQWLFGNGRFLLRQLEGAKAEMALAMTLITSSERLACSEYAS